MFEIYTWGTNGGGNFLALKDIKFRFCISFVAFIAASDEIRFSGRTHNRDWMNFVNSGDHLLEYEGGCPSSEFENKAITVDNEVRECISYGR